MAHVLLALQTASSGQFYHTIDAPNSLQQAVHDTLDILLVGPKLDPRSRRILITCNGDIKKLKLERALSGEWMGHKPDNKCSKGNKTAMRT